jgi:hypothetical protein
MIAVRAAITNAIALAAIRFLSPFISDLLPLGSPDAIHGSRFRRGPEAPLKSR